MALRRQRGTGYGIFDYWSIASGFSGNHSEDRIEIILNLYKDRDYKHEGFQFYGTETVSIKFSDWVIMFINDNDYDPTRASYRCIKQIDGWSESSDILEQGQIG